MPSIETDGNAVAPVLALLVDRDEDTRLMYGEYLRHLAYEVDEAEDGREALVKAIAHRPAVIVTEARLPGISGVELCRLLRKDAATRAIPIVVVTADALASDKKLAEAAGANAVWSSHARRRGSPPKSGACWRRRRRRAPADAS